MSECCADMAAVRIPHVVAKIFFTNVEVLGNLDARISRLSALLFKNLLKQ